MISDQPAPNTVEDQGADTGLTPDAVTRAATTLEAAVATSPRGDQRSDSGAANAAVSQEEMADLSARLGERGVDLGGLLTAMMAASSQTKPKPAAGKETAGRDEDPAVLLGKLAKSLGISPAELVKRLQPLLKQMLSGQGASTSAKPRRKSKKDGAKPAAKPKPKPTSKPEKDTAKAKPKPKPAGKPKKDSAKPAAKPKPKPTAKPKKDSAKPAVKPKTKPAAKPKEDSAKPTAKLKPKPAAKPKKATSTEPIAQ